MAAERCPKLVIATGISGCGGKDYLRRWTEYAKKGNRNVIVFNAGEMMSDYAREMGLQLNGNNILNANRNYLDLLRSAVFHKILSIMHGGSEKYDCYVIVVHAWFYWLYRYIWSWDKFLHEFSPDFYLTFIDDYRAIAGQLKNRVQWRDQPMDEEKILEWQGLEVGTTAGLAALSQQPFFAVPAAAHESLLYRLIFHPEQEAVYSAMPISHFSNPEDRRKIDWFVERVEQYFPVFNPISVDVVGAFKVDSEMDGRNQAAIRHNIIYRDVEWFIPQSGKVVVYWPERPLPKEIKGNDILSRLWPRAISSPGIDHESHEAFSLTKDVWLICENKEISPFVSHYCTKFFPRVGDFFKFMDEQNWQKHNWKEGPPLTQ